MQSVTDLKDTSPKLEPDISRHKHDKNNSEDLREVSVKHNHTKKVKGKSNASMWHNLMLIQQCEKDYLLL